MKHILLFLLMLTSSVASFATDFADYCYKYEHNLAQNHTLRKLYIQFDIGDCLAVESMIARTTHLDLSRAQIIDVKPFQYMPSVVHLNLSNNRISDVVDLSRAYQLESLDLSNNNIYDFSPLIKLTQLKNLNISGNPIDKNSYNCPTNSQNRALTFACFDIDAFESEFYEQDTQSLSTHQLEYALAQVFEDRAINFDEIVSLNRFTLKGKNQLQVTIQGKTFIISGNHTSAYALKINVMQSDQLLKIEFYSLSGNGTARFKRINGKFMLKNVER